MARGPSHLRGGDVPRTGHCGAGPSTVGACGRFARWPLETKLDSYDANGLATRGCYRDEIKGSRTDLS